MRSVLALLAFAFFGFNAISMTDAGWDPTLEPVFHMFQILFVGLTVLSLSIVDWRRSFGPLLHLADEEFEPRVKTGV